MLKLRTRILTHHVEAKALADLWLGGHLTLVGARVPRLGGRDAEGPLVGSLGVQGLEALVVRVGEYAHCKDVQVPLPDPGHLQEKWV